MDTNMDKDTELLLSHGDTTKYPYVHPYGVSMYMECGDTPITQNMHK